MFDKWKTNIHLQHPDQANNTNLMQTSRYSLNFPGEQPEKDCVPFLLSNIDYQYTLALNVNPYNVHVAPPALVVLQTSNPRERLLLNSVLFRCICMYM